MQSPPPLCEFIDYMDLEQSPEDIAEVERIARDARARWRCSTILCSVAIKLCWRRRSSDASLKLRVSRVKRKHESALKTASAAKERNVRLRGRGCARELIALGNLERQDSGRESIPVARG